MCAGAITVILSLVKITCLLLSAEPLSLFSFSHFRFAFLFCDCDYGFFAVSVPGVEGKVCNRFLPSKANDPHRLCCSCRGEACSLDDHRKECHDLPDDCCKRVNMIKLLLQQEKQIERKAKASSSSSLGFYH